MAANRCALLSLVVLAAGCNPILGPSTKTSDWRTLDFARFTFYVRAGSFCEANAAAIDEVLEEQYAFALASIDAQLDRHIWGFLYPSAAEAGLLSDRSGTAYVDTGAFNAVCTPPLDGNLFALVQHESNHVVFLSALGRAGTFLLTEGLASAVISERYHRLGKTFLYTWTRDHRGQLPLLADLADDDRWKGISQQTAYNTGASFLAYALETYGPRPLRAIYYARSEEFADRARSAYGKPLQDLEAEWLRFCAAF